MAFLKKWSTCVIIIILGIAMFIFSLVSFNGKIQNTVKHEMNRYITNVRDNAALIFNNEIKRFSNSIADEARLLSKMDMLTENEIISELKDFVTINHLNSVSIYDLDGDLYSSNSDTILCCDPSTINTETFKEDCFDSQLTTIVEDGQAYFVATAPIYSNNEISSILEGRYDVNILNKMVTDIFPEDSCGVGIVAPDGLVLGRSNIMPMLLPTASNIFELLSHDNGSFKHGSVAAIQSDMLANKSGIATYFDNKMACSIAYAPIGINDWYVYSVSNDVALVKQAGAIKKYAFYLVMQLLAIIAVLVTRVLWIRAKESKHYVSELSRIAYVDSLTGAANKKQFKHSASQLLDLKANSYAFLVLDIDKFKVLNDTLGYESGDELLCIIANILSDNMGEDEIFGRCDSDEYYLLLKYIDNKQIKERVEQLFQKIQAEFSTKMNNNYNLVLCVGIYAIQSQLTEINIIMDRAKHAHQLSKGGSNSSTSFYSEELHNKILEEKVIENKMHDALENCEFMLYLQPKYRLDDETMCGAEALVRWDTKGSAMLFPDQFIPVFEKTGFTTQLDMYMLEKACVFIKSWIERGITPLPISINFSRVHLRNLNFVEDIAFIVKKHNIPPHLIEVELTESTIMDNESLLIDMLSQLHEHGFALSMDDFGSGYSSLGLLKNLPVDTIKLDRTFFTKYNDLKRAKIVIANIINMAKELEIYTVAEGVETKEHIDLLRELGCDIVQGYYYARPMKAEELVIP